MSIKMLKVYLPSLGTFSARIKIALVARRAGFYDRLVALLCCLLEAKPIVLWFKVIIQTTHAPGDLTRHKTTASLTSAIQYQACMRVMLLRRSWLLENLFFHAASRMANYNSTVIPTN